MADWITETIGKVQAADAQAGADADRLSFKLRARIDDTGEQRARLLFQGRLMAEAMRHTGDPDVLAACGALAVCFAVRGEDPTVTAMDLAKRAIAFAEPGTEITHEDLLPASTKLVVDRLALLPATAREPKAEMVLGIAAALLRDELPYDQLMQLALTRQKEDIAREVSEALVKSLEQVI